MQDDDHFAGTPNPSFVQQDFHGKAENVPIRDAIPILMPLGKSNRQSYGAFPSR